MTSRRTFKETYPVKESYKRFDRDIGYHAVPCGNDTAISVPITIQAGLGHVGRHGRLIT